MAWYHEQGRSQRHGIGLLVIATRRRFGLNFFSVVEVCAFHSVYPAINYNRSIGLVSLSQSQAV